VTGKAILQGGTSLSVKAGAGVITLDPSGVAIMGPLVRINEGGGGGSAQAANPTQPGNPAEADNDAPGAKLRAASAASTPTDTASSAPATASMTRQPMSSLRKAPWIATAAREHSYRWIKPIFAWNTMATRPQPLKSNLMKSPKAV